MKKIYLISSILIGLFFVSCSKDDDNIHEIINQNSSSNISVEETNIIGMKGSTGTLTLNFNKFYLKKTKAKELSYLDSALVMKIGNDTLYYRINPSNNTTQDSYFTGKREIQVTIPFLDRDVENEQIKIYDKNGTFLINGPNITIQKAYELVVIRDIDAYSVLFPLVGEYYYITWGFYGMCAFDEESVIVRRGVDFYQNPPIKLFNFKFGNFTPENNYNFSYEFSEQKNCPNDNIKNLSADSPNRMGLTYSNEKYYFSWLVKIDGEYKTKIFVSNETGTEIFKEGIVTQNFEGRIQDIEVDSKGNMYVIDKFRVDKNVTHLKLYNPDLTESADQFLTIGSSTEAGYINGSKNVARFNNIKEISIDGNDNVYVAEETCIRKITSSGEVSTLIGTNEAGDIDGDANNARFQGIKSIYAMKDGSIYILEENNIKILNKEHTNVKSFPIRNKLRYGGRILAPIFVTNDGIIYFHTQNYYGYVGVGCLILEDLVPKTILQNYPYGMFLNKKTENNSYYYYTL